MKLSLLVYKKMENKSLSEKEILRTLFEKDDDDSHKEKEECSHEDHIEEVVVADD
jgi:hypothetical protein